MARRKTYSKYHVDLSEQGKKDRVGTDYKTGEKHNKHKAQLEEYELALQEMKYTVAKKALIYIGESIEIVTL